MSARAVAGLSGADMRRLALAGEVERLAVERRRLEAVQTAERTALDAALADARMRLESAERVLWPEAVPLALVEQIAAERGRPVSRATLARWCKDGTGPFGKAGEPNGPTRGATGGDRNAPGWLVPKARLVAWLDDRAGAVVGMVDDARPLLGSPAPGTFAALSERVREA